MKIGERDDFFGRRWSETVADLDAWMKSDGDDAVADRLHDVLLSLMPRTNFLSLISKPCVTTCGTTASCRWRRWAPTAR